MANGIYQRNSSVVCDKFVFRPIWLGQNSTMELVAQRYGIVFKTFTSFKFIELINHKTPLVRKYLLLNIDVSYRLS